VIVGKAAIGTVPGLAQGSDGEIGKNEDRYLGLEWMGLSFELSRALEQIHYYTTHTRVHWYDQNWE
jgi:hypothetical protein